MSAISCASHLFIVGDTFGQTGINDKALVGSTYVTNICTIDWSFTTAN